MSGANSWQRVVPTFLFLFQYIAPYWQPVTDFPSLALVLIAVLCNLVQDFRQHITWNTNLTHTHQTAELTSATAWCGVWIVSQVSSAVSHYSKALLVLKWPAALYCLPPFFRKQDWALPTSWICLIFFHWQSAMNSTTERWKCWSNLFSNRSIRYYQ